MASTSESGHDINVANFEDLITFCQGCGATYNPSNAALKIPQLQATQIAAKNVMHTVTTTKTVFDKAVDKREIAFAPLKPLSTQVYNSLKSSGATKQVIADADTVNHKIQGKRADNSKSPVPPVSENPPTLDEEKKQISVSQQSMDSEIAHFTKLIEIVSTEPAYAPNEAELKVTALNTFLAALKAANTLVINATEPYSNALIARNTTLYSVGTGLVDIAIAVKDYVKSIYKASSPQYKHVNKIHFRNRR